MTQDSYLALYHRFVAIIDRAAQTKDYGSVTDAAIAVGMAGGEEPRNMGQRWNYRHADESGTELLVHARWYDSSGPVTIGPDIHIMRVELKGPGVALSHEQRYEVPLYG